MATKNATIRIPEDMANWLTSSGDSINQGVINSIETLKTIQDISMNELKGVFTPTEWKFLADSMNGIIIDTLRFNKDILISYCEDAEIYENKATKWDLDLNKFKNKIISLHGANINAIYSRLEKFYSNDSLQEEGIDAWATF